MLEPIQSMAGVRTAAPEFFRALRDLCDERGIVLIYDEVQTGVGRTGEWFFAGSDAGAGVVPDIVTLAKALGSGIPVGACLVNEHIASHIKENDLGTTFGGGMVAMAAVTATLEAIENDAMIENVRTVEAYLRERLSEVPEVVSVRGRGFLLGLEFQREGGADSSGVARTEDHHRYLKRSERAETVAAAVFAESSSRFVRCCFEGNPLTSASCANERKQGNDVEYGWYDLAGNIGVLMMVIAYLLLQLDKLSSSAVSYLLLNALGAVLVIVSLMFRFNLSAFLMEVFWLLISLFGLAKSLYSKPAV